MAHSIKKTLAALKKIGKSLEVGAVKKSKEITPEEQAELEQENMVAPVSEETDLDTENGATESAGGATGPTFPGYGSSGVQGHIGVSGVQGYAGYQGPYWGNVAIAQNAYHPSMNMPPNVQWDHSGLSPGYAPPPQAIKIDVEHLDLKSGDILMVRVPPNYPDYSMKPFMEELKSLNKKLQEKGIELIDILIMKDNTSFTVLHTNTSNQNEHFRKIVLGDEAKA